MNKKNEIIYFNKNIAIRIHDEKVLKNGIDGLMGIKDEGQLDSVLYNIQNDLYYPTFIDKITHLVFCLVKFHIFNDGNKRTALACSAYFLQINGYNFLINDYMQEMENICVWLAENCFDKEFLRDLIGDLINYSEISYANKIKLVNFLEESE